MDFKPIETDEDYWAVCAALEPILFSAEPNSPEAARAEMQLLLVRAYEGQNPPWRTIRSECRWGR